MGVGPHTRTLVVVGGLAVLVAGDSGLLAWAGTGLQPAAYLSTTLLGEDRSSRNTHCWLGRKVVEAARNR